MNSYNRESVSTYSGSPTSTLVVYTIQLGNLTSLNLVTAVLQKICLAITLNKILEVKRPLFKSVTLFPELPT